MKKAIIAATLAAVAIPAAPALADPPHWAPAHGYRDKHRSIYDSRGRYIEPRRISRDDYVWRGRDGRYYCKRSNGTTGLIIGAAGGALLGRAIDTRGDRAMGTILGAAGGALLGREIERSGGRCR
ncbi:17 kDa surface antigen [Novosphingobium aromaticivorans DSM 12444]|uniref:17 kDa surface antigen n=1 Tax=Novosphingobium aromaticivorans (strain ATCC 700278 / DSM 12444 / CCUG 56034 / CIP 105152 / NBRC 16084 / F199) TaxID=279238 RepID=Q2G547_NOVAD|nr:glycine zipper 2TM domain-containing protein [Novosphingobium aromaticivorans]ABD27026.1 17 kDa surface antigen [Novosphingobium aromaticivorans DSM 12444]SCY48320.1 Glycine zipper 2TM domain-containing protein [Novosphingobium aromaticivorans]